jgi:transposase
MDSKKYIGMDVHKESISIAVRNDAGKIVMECVIETKAGMILQFIDGLRGDVHVTFEEGTWAAWLYDLLTPHVNKVVVCDPRRNALLREGNQNDRVDARKLAELLHNNQLRSVYHGDHGLRTLKELVRSYLTITQDLSRVMTRLKAIYRSWAIPYTGKQVYAPRHRAEWLAKISEPGVRRRAEFCYQQLDALRCLRQQVRRDLLARSTRPGNGSAESPRLVRSGRLSYWEFYRPRTGSAASGSCGPMAVSASRPAAARITRL